MLQISHHFHSLNGNFSILLINFDKDTWFRLRVVRLNRNVKYFKHRLAYETTETSHSPGDVINMAFLK
jgi:hypothetical protein